MTTEKKIVLTGDDKRVLTVLSQRGPMKFYDVADHAFPNLEKGDSGLKAVFILRKLRMAGLCRHDHQLRSGLTEVGVAAVLEAA